MDPVKMYKVHRDAMRRWSKLAVDRNSLIDKDKVVYCPVKMVEVSKDNPNPQRSLLHFLCNFYYPGISVKDSTFFVTSGYAFKTLKHDQNQWLYSHIEGVLRYRLTKKPDTIDAGARATIEDYKEGNLTSEDAIFLLLPADVFSLDASQEQLFIYLPIADPIDDEKAPKRVAKGGGGTAGNVLSRRKDSANFLYLDVGAWSSPQTLGLKGHAAFGIVAPEEVALWDLQADKGQLKTSRTMKPGGIVRKFWEKYHKELGGNLLFYGYFNRDRSISSPGSLIVPTDNSIKSYSYTPPIPTPLTDNDVLVIIPDLHLHLFPGLSVDNFIEPWKGGDSLMGYLSGIFDYWSQFSEDTGALVRIIQVGDLFELWESALFLLFARDSKYLDKTSDIGVQRDVIKKWQKLLEQVVKARGLDTVFPTADLDMLEKNKWDTSGLIPIWQKMETEIKKAHTKKDVRGQDWGIFKDKGFLNSGCLGDWQYVGGNHDSFISKVAPKKFGVNDCLWIEHGHLKDPKNSPQAINSGTFFTGLNVLAELKKIGDPIKSIESSRRPLFLGNAADVNKQRIFKEGKRPYSMIITGHTHRGYAAMVQVNRSLPNQFQVLQLFYDQGWESLDWKGYVKKLPYAVPLLYTSGESPSLQTVVRIIAGLAKYK